MKKVVLNPTLACADRMNMGRDVDTLVDLGAEMLHLDIMDGHYVPNLCLDFDTLHAIKNRTNVPLDIHLMVNDPFAYLERAAALSPEYLSFHIDATAYPIRLINEINKRGIKAGVVLNPAQSVKMLEYVVGRVQMIQLMSVEPGFAGQRFIPSTLDKIEKLIQIRDSIQTDFVITIDGGIDIECGRQCADRGADIIVVGALAVFLKNKPLMVAYRDFERAIQE